jgi:hypothetical protein
VLPLPTGAEDGHLLASASDLQGSTRRLSSVDATTSGRQHYQYPRKSAGERL